MLKDIHAFCQLTRVIEDVPQVMIESFKGFLEPLVAVLGFLVHLCDARYASNVNGADPTGEFPRNIAIGFWILLSAVSNADHASVREPGVNLHHAIELVFLRILTERGNQSPKILPKTW